MRPKLIRKIIGALSITSVMFTFQACYGTPQDFELDVHLKGTVISEKTGQPIKGIRVSTVEEYQYIETDDSGKYSFYVPAYDNLLVSFQDIDSSGNGNYLPKDTIISVNDDELTLNISLTEK